MVLSPPHWTNEEIKAERDRSEQRFIEARQNEGPAVYYKEWDKAAPDVRAALLQTKNLQNIIGDTLISNKQLWQTLRYVCAPRISEEDLWTIVGKKFKTVPSEFADITAKTISELIDTTRFPWIDANRDPKQNELDSAIVATTTLLAHEALGTRRRGSASQFQEDQVSKSLIAAGLGSRLITNN